MAAGRPVGVSFTPTLVPMARGILATCSARTTPGTDAEAARAAPNLAERHHLTRQAARICQALRG